MQFPINLIRGDRRRETNTANTVSPVKARKDAAAALPRESATRYLFRLSPKGRDLCLFSILHFLPQLKETAADERTRELIGLVIAVCGHSVSPESVEILNLNQNDPGAFAELVHFCVVSYSPEKGDTSDVGNV